VANPKVGSWVQHPDTAAEEQAAEVVRNHEGGTWSERARFDPKPGAARRTVGVDSATENDEGAIFDNLKRGGSAVKRWAAWTERRERRRQRSRGSTIPRLASWNRPLEVVLEGPA
jgi:hypothetical protein